MMLGHCYAFKNDRSFSDLNNARRIIPLEDKNTQEWNGYFYGQMNGRDGWDVDSYRFGNIFAELGSALHYDQLDERLLFGAPGSWNWTGTTIMYAPFL